MRPTLIVLALLGIIASSLALREHYNTGDSPCDINAKWDCGVVNKSIFAMVGPIPVAAIGIAGYLLLGFLAFRRAYLPMRIATTLALAFSLYLAHIEKDLLQVWCIYCVCSLVIISLMTLLLFSMKMVEMARRKQTSAKQRA
jgi:vitamin-K-epoxide reductase (warfarin-sensitive)